MYLLKLILNRFLFFQSKINRNICFVLDRTLSQNLVGLEIKFCNLFIDNDINN